MEFLSEEDMLERERLLKEREAQMSRANKANMIMGLGDALARYTAAGGGAKYDSGASDAVRQGLQQQMQMREQARKEQLRNIVAEAAKRKQFGMQQDRIENEDRRLKGEEEWRRGQFDYQKSQDEIANELRELQIRATAGDRAAARELENKKLELQKLQIEQASKRAAAAAAEAKNAPKPQSATQLRKKGFADIGEKASSQYEAAVAKGKATGANDPTSSWEIIDNSSWLPKSWKSDAAIERMNAEAAWVGAYLRDESGAAIPNDEREGFAKDYFPRPGDTPAVVENKRNLREEKMKAIRREAGEEFTPKESQQKPTGLRERKAAVEKTLNVGESVKFDRKSGKFVVVDSEGNPIRWGE